MSKLSRAESARVNGAKSRGPLTLEGKARSSRNAITHGLTCSPRIALANESSDEFNRVYQAYVDKFDPQDQEELDAVTQYVSARWRLFRAWSFETEMVNENLKAIYDLLVTAAPDAPATSAATPTFMAFERGLRESKLLMMLPRYETNLRHTLNQAEFRLRRIIAERKEREADAANNEGEAAVANSEREADATTNQEREASAPPKTPPQNEPKFTHRPGRNTPCPCGSGLKFKRCCISKIPRAA